VFPVVRPLWPAKHRDPFKQEAIMPVFIMLIGE
jgi:hypothetical protein